MTDWLKTMNPNQVQAICTAYESGFGHGYNRREPPLGNPYHDGVPEAQAYAIGVAEGELRKKREASETPPKGFDRLGMPLLTTNR